MDEKVIINTTKEWARLLQVASKVKFGRVEVVMQNGKPIRIDAVTQQIRLDQEDDFKKDLETVDLL